MAFILRVQTDIGNIGIVESDGKIIRLLFDGQEYEGEAQQAETETLLEAARQLKEYLAGERQEFSLEYAFHGTEFQKLCWEALCKIPYGQTRSYSDIAWEIGREKAVRAVGLANNRNPIPIFIPCHRVVGKSGKLVGFGGGLDLKARLLTLEKEKV